MERIPVAAWLVALLVLPLTTARTTAAASSLSELSGSAIPVYEIGDRSRQTVVTPIALAITDASETERLRQAEKNRVPAVFRYLANSYADTEKQFRRMVTSVRLHFAESLEIAAKRRKLDPETLKHPSFARFVTWFKQQHPDFPMTMELARHWAAQEPDDAILARWLRSLSQVMDHCVHSDHLPQDLLPGPGFVRMVPVGSVDESITAKTVDNQGVKVVLTNLLTISQARERLKRGLPKGSDHPQLGRFLAAFVTENCFPESELTREARSRHVGDILAVDHFESGETIVMQGQLITPRIKAALDSLRSQQEAVLAASVASAGKGDGLSGDGTDSKPHATSASTESADGLMLGLAGRIWSWWSTTPFKLERLARSGLWLLAGLSLVLMIVLAWLVRRKQLARVKETVEADRDEAFTVILNPDRNETIFMPSKAEPATTQTENAFAARVASEEKEPSEPVSEEADQPGTFLTEQGKQAQLFWKQRAMEAERRADEIVKMVRAGLAPQLARQMMSKLVQELIHQRADWLETQRLAESDLLKIEQRFLQSHTMLQEKLKAFEKRADELEKALQQKAEENSELLKAHIALAQQQIKASEKSDQEEKLPLWN